jgi:hypothetical protein
MFVGADLSALHGRLKPTHNWYQWGVNEIHPTATKSMTRKPYPCHDFQKKKNRNWLSGLSLY